MQVATAPLGMAGTESSKVVAVDVDHHHPGHHGVQLVTSKQLQLQGYNNSSSE